MKSVPLHDPTHFELIPGLWKGEREPLISAKVLRGTNFAGDGLLDFDDVAELEVEGRHFESRRLQPGDIIVERSGGGPKQPVGRVALFDPPDGSAYFCSNFTTTIRVRDRSKFDPAYVALYLHGLYLQGVTETLQRATTGIRNLDWQGYLRFEVPVRALGQQRLLVRLIGGVRTAYRNEQRLVRTFTELKRAAMRELFTRGLRGEPQKETEIGLVPESWEVAKLKSIAQARGGTSFPPTLQGKAHGDFPFYKVSDMNLPGNELEMHAAANWITSSELDFLRAKPFPPETIIFPKVGGALHTNKKRMLTAESVLDNNIMGVTVKDRFRCLPRFLFAWFQTVNLSAIANAGPLPSINGNQLYELDVPVPSIDEQREIVTILDAIDRKIELHRKKRAVTEELFKALLHKLMTGEIRVADLDFSALEPQRLAQPTP
jgi:type I restriction enzyme S subunit